MMIQTMELVNRVTTCSRVAEVEGGIGCKESHSFQGNLQEAHPLWEETIWMDRVTKVHDSQTRWGILREVVNQGRQEEALG